MFLNADNTEFGNNTEQASPIVQLWILRILLMLDGHRGWLEENSVSNGSLAYIIGLPHWADGSRRYSKSRLMTELRERLAVLEKDSTELPYPLGDNLKKLSAILGLNQVEQDVLGLMILMKVEEGLDIACRVMGQIYQRDIPRVVSKCLNVPIKTATDVFRGNSSLSRASVIELHSYARKLRLDLSDHIDFVSDSFMTNMVYSLMEPLEMFRGHIEQVKESSVDLGLADYPHIKRKIELVIHYLNAYIDRPMVGLNFLIYGPPGTGKTELVSVLAKAIAVPLYVVSTEDVDANPMNGRQRLQSMRAVQSLLSSERALLLFDEAEDVFGSDRNPNDDRGTGGKKAWLNKLIETNRIPCIWVSNSVNTIDPAHMRRFRVVIDTRITSATHRHEILNRIGEGLIDNRLIRDIANSEAVTPGIFANAIDVAKQVRNSSESCDTQENTIYLLNGALHAQGKSRIVPGRSHLPELYSPAFNNTDRNLEDLAEGISIEPSARLCFYGPPGTGKTAFAQFLAKVTDSRLVNKKASDLLSPYVGGTEAKLAEAFSEAQGGERTILLIDEVDSFLQKRDHARYSWEISMVNELLTQMEDFEGTFIATTNLLEQMDMAAMRRFDFKVSFTYLNPEQAVMLLRRSVEFLGLNTPNEQDVSALSKLEQLTAGDFSIIMRQARFNPFSNTEAVVRELKRIQHDKQPQKKPIGF